MLLDDGELDDWKEEARRDQKQISLSDVLQLLQTKYGALQDLVLTHMAQEEAGELQAFLSDLLHCSEQDCGPRQVSSEPFALKVR